MCLNKRECVRVYGIHVVRNATNGVVFSLFRPYCKQSFILVRLFDMGISTWIHKKCYLVAPHLTDQRWINKLWICNNNREKTHNKWIKSHWKWAKERERETEREKEGRNENFQYNKRPDHSLGHDSLSIRIIFFTFAFSIQCDQFNWMTIAISSTVVY